MIYINGRLRKPEAAIGQMGEYTGNNQDTMRTLSTPIMRTSYNSDFTPSSAPVITPEVSFEEDFTPSSAIVMTPSISYVIT